MPLLFLMLLITYSFSLSLSLLYESSSLCSCVVLIILILFCTAGNLSITALGLYVSGRRICQRKLSVFPFAGEGGGVNLDLGSDRDSRNPLHTKTSNYAEK